MASNDAVTQPDHYARWSIEPITFAMVNGLPYAEGNVIKYICRHDAKNGAEDVRKVLRYAQMILQEHYGQYLPIDWDREYPVMPASEAAEQVGGVAL